MQRGPRLGRVLSLYLILSAFGISLYSVNDHLRAGESR